MGRLAATIRRAVADEMYFVSWHAGEMLEERGISDWQLVVSIDEAVLVRERPGSRPNPSVVLRHMLSSGEEVDVVWSWLSRTGKAKLVTVFFRN